jgi:RecB family endonuclease NucS
MLAILLGHPSERVRGILVARTIHAHIKEQAQRYGIETIEVPRFR